MLVIPSATQRWKGSNWEMSCHKITGYYSLSLLLLLKSLAGNKHHYHSSKILPCVKEIISLATRHTRAPTLQTCQEIIKKYLRFQDSPRRASKVTSYLSEQFGIDLQIKNQKIALWGKYSWYLVLRVIQTGSPTEAAAALHSGIQPYQG